MEYYDQINIRKAAFKDDDLFKALLSALMHVISDNELTLFDTKDLIGAINDELELIQVENVR